MAWHGEHGRTHSFPHRPGADRRGARTGCRLAVGSRPRQEAPARSSYTTGAPARPDIGRTDGAGGNIKEEHQMKQYLLSIYQPDGDPPPSEVLEPIMRNIHAVEQEMKAAAVWVFSGGLHAPSTATALRLRDGDLLMTDGPFAEGKEHIGGICIIKAPDLDAALEWGRKLAQATTLPIEVRPFQGEE